LLRKGAVIACQESRFEDPVMSNARRTSKRPLDRASQLRYARQIIELEARALSQLAGRLDASFCAGVAALYGCGGSVITTGMGKAGMIAQKIAATLASTGTRSHWLQPSTAIWAASVRTTLCCCSHRAARQKRSCGCCRR